MKHVPTVDLERTNVRQLRVGFAWCTCGRPLVISGRASSPGRLQAYGWRHDTQSGRKAA